MRILLVAEHDSVREPVVRALEGLPIRSRLMLAHSPASALGRLAVLTPDLLLIDGKLTRTVIEALVDRVRASVGKLPIAVLVDHDELSSAQEVLGARASALAIDSIRSGDLASLLEPPTGAQNAEPAASPGAASVSAPALRAGQVIAFCAASGGTGRTTIAINIATALARLAYGTVVLVDADTFAPSLASFFDLPSEQFACDLFTGPNVNVEALESSLRMGPAGIKLLPRHPQSCHMKLSSEQAHALLAHLRGAFDWTVLDVGPVVDPGASALVEQAELVCVMMVPEVTVLRNTALLLSKLDAHGVEAGRQWVILNRDGEAGGLKAESIRREGLIFSDHIPDDRELATRSVGEGVPAVLLAPDSNLSRACLSLAVQVATHVEGRAPAQVGAAESRMPVSAVGSNTTRTYAVA